MQEEFNRIHKKLDTIETKIDGHLERLSRAETAIGFIRTHLSISTFIFLGVVGFIARAWANSL